MKKSSKSIVLLFVLVLGLSVSAVSATPAAISQPMTAQAEAQAVGGSCGGAVGLGVGLALGALSPCSIVCAVGAWYSLAAIAWQCD